MKVLAKGMNFALTPRKIPYEQIICSVEDCLFKNNIGKEDLEAIRQDISSLLRRSSVPKPNLPKDEYTALNNLRNRPELTILRADKGNATVVMDTSEYNFKIQQLLSDESTYKKVKTDPTTNTLKTTSDLIKKYSEKLNLDVNSLIPSCAKPPRLYGLPKIHKPNAPLRPIVSQIDSPTYKLAQYLAKILSPLRGHTRAHTKDSYHFVSEIKDLHLANNETMVSFDVQSLFTCLPIVDCISIVTRKLEENNMPQEYAILLEHCLTSGYLLWKEEFYKQVDGVAMGSPVSPIVADIFMEDFEEKALLTAPVNPRFYKRYVDDTFTILPSDKVTAFLDHLNSINSKIQFTMELEANNSLAFLDVLVIRNPDNTIGHTVYRKKTHTNRYLNGESHHHPSQLATVGKSLFQRARGICDRQHLAAELQHVKQVLQDNKLRVPRLRHSERVKPATVERAPALLPYVRGVTDKIGYILKRASIKTYYKPLKKISQFLPSIKCNIPLQDAGVPFTMKESQEMKGFYNTLGLWSRRTVKSTEDSEAVVLLKEAGAIPLAATNLPEILIWQETRNPVYGMTYNPHHSGRSPGGSSGGEAALSASYATPISLCSDIAGSTRMPAFYCGVFGHHPTAGTTSSKGVFLRKGGEETMLCLGFISKHAEDLGPLTKIIAGDKAKLLDLDRSVNMKDIKFYYLDSAEDHFVSPVRQEMKNVMQRVIAKITQDLTSTVNAPQKYMHEGFNHMYRLWSYWMDKEPDDYMALYAGNGKRPNAFLELAKKLLGISRHCLFTILRLFELQLFPKVHSEWAEKLTKQMKDDLFGKLGDNGVLLLVSSPHAAPFHYSCMLRPFNFSYFSIVNVLKCPATQVPLGTNSIGLPIGIQILAAPYNDALCLAVAKYLEKEFGGAVMACKVKTS